MSRAGHVPDPRSASTREPRTRPWRAATRGAAAWTWRALQWSAVQLRRASAWLGAQAWSRRAVIAALASRAAWWGVLALWWITAVALFDGRVIDVDGALQRFAVGTAVCAALVLFASARRLRWLGGALGSLHGTSALALWFVANA